MLQKYLLLCLAGAAGTLARFWVGGFVQRLAGEAFPLGNFVVNLSGCLFFGLVYALVESRSGLPGELRLYVLTGFMGAYTTFSTYMFESVALMQHGQWLAAAGNLVGQTVLGVVCIMAGLAVGRFF